MTGVAAPLDAPGRSTPAGIQPAAFTGTGTLLRFNLRRDRVRMSVWLLALTLGTLATAAEYKTLYSTPEERAAAVSSMDSPAALAMTGPRPYLSDYTAGAMLGHQMLGFMAVLVGLMSVLTVIRHTRDEEETGRAELVRSTVVGHHAHLAAALAVALVANLGLALLLTLGLTATGVDGVGPGRALLYGLAHAAIGLVFAGVAAITAQLTAHTRGASGLALATIGVAYVLRASGDVGNDALSWLSPIGWIQRTYVFVDDRWWPLALCLLLAAATAAYGFVLSTRRDVGAGLRPARLGRRTASDALTRPFGFALRLHRATLLGFAAGLCLMGVMYGSILGEAADMVESVEQLQEALKDIGGATVAESFASMVMVVVAVVAAVYVVMAALRPRAEENAGRAEPLLATGLSRDRWLGSHVAVALTGGTALLVLAGLCFGVSGAASAGDGSLVLELTLAAAAYAPALWATVGVAVLLFGWFPRAGAVAWIVPVYAFLVGYLGPVLQLPDGLTNLSPFGHVPQLPAAGMTWTPLLALTAVAAGLIALGLAGFRRRDLDTK
ncbi:ABC transporter permease [Streptomyces sp. MBT67]|uniref:ABC transporter permease n=1 Tax=unclassified Streptomyces TaxID=2593676 RepID=UPI00190AA9BE|nr:MULTISPECIES: ABC transporter permease [unclassified Streptomyces]MBK3528238.1 ABC transporter permease [Streptomyces sp. MBT72]MBK3537761.1 ABC transporter permease [Streptomyces sp. MBT67]MBK3549372.1 ABC transporter permease [Streptomyces sp. MBT61]MBK6027873.1 ABC transporter permease [Streptomyces sp. MBT59]